MRALSNSQKALVFSILLFALFLRLVNINEHSLWFDEKTSVLIAQGIKYGDATSHDSIVSSNFLNEQNNLQHVYSSTIADNGNCVAYNFTLHFWVNIFGTSDSAARLLSVLFSLASLVLIFLFSLKNYGFKIAAFVLVLFALNPLSVAYANEARGYSMGTFFTLSASLILWQFIFHKEVDKPWLKVLLYGLCAGLALLSHYLTASVFIAHALIALILLRNKKGWIYLISGGAIAVFIFALWMLNGGLEGLKILKYQTDAYAKILAEYKEGTSGFVMPATIGNMVTGAVQVWLQEFGNGLQAFFRIRMIMPLLLLPLGIIAFLFWKNKENRKQYLFFFTIFITQILFAAYSAFSSGHTISFQPLYSNFAAPYIFLFLALGLFYIYEKNKIVGGVLIAIQIVILNFSLNAVYSDIPKNRKSNPYPQIAASLENSKNTIQCSTWKDVQMLSLYLPKEKNYTFKIDTALGDVILGDAVSYDLKDLRY